MCLIFTCTGKEPTFPTITPLRRYLADCERVELVSCCDEDRTLTFRIRTQCAAVADLTSILMELSLSWGILNECTQRFFSSASAICLDIEMRTKYLCRGIGNSACRDPKLRSPEPDTSALEIFVMFLDILEREIGSVCLTHRPKCGELL